MYMNISKESKNPSNRLITYPIYSELTKRKIQVSINLKILIKLSSINKIEEEIKFLFV